VDSVGQDPEFVACGACWGFFFLDWDEPKELSWEAHFPAAYSELGG